MRDSSTIFPTSRSTGPDVNYFSKWFLDLFGKRSRDTVSVVSRNWRRWSNGRTDGIKRSGGKMWQGETE